MLHCNIIDVYVNVNSRDVRRHPLHEVAKAVLTHDVLVQRQHGGHDAAPQAQLAVPGEQEAFGRVIAGLVDYVEVIAQRAVDVTELGARR